MVIYFWIEINYNVDKYGVAKISNSIYFNFHVRPFKNQSWKMTKWSSLGWVKLAFENPKKNKTKKKKKKSVSQASLTLRATALEVTYRRDSLIICFDRRSFPLRKAGKSQSQSRSRSCAGKGIYLGGLAKELRFLLSFLLVLFAF